MSLSSFAVRRRVTVLMIYVVVLGFGVFSFARLKLDLYPDITFPLVGVITQYNGASPEDIEQLVSRPVEEACASVEGVKEVRSESRMGVSVVFVEFNWGTDIDQAEVDIRKNLDFFKAQMPMDAEPPITFAFDPSMQPILFYSLSGPFDQARLRDIGTHGIEPLLERLPGVASADTMGGLRREIQVRVLPERLTAAGLSVNQVIGALRRENVQVPAGFVNSDRRELSIQTRGNFQSVEDIKEVVVGTAGGVPLRLSDVAEVVDTVHEETRVLRAGGKAAVMLMVRKQSGANTVQTAEAVTGALPRILAGLPTGVTLSPIYNQSDFINQAIDNLSNSALLAVGITILVLLFFLRSFAAAIIVGISIPASVVVSFAVMDEAGLTLNILSMAGLALAVGMLVDNSIVVLENVYRHLQMGKTRFQAAIDGAAEVATAITASTLTTVVVFAPILFVPGLAGAMFRDMAATICISLAASLLVALTLIPLGVSYLVRKVPNITDNRLLRTYVRLQSVTLRRRVPTLAVALVTLALGVGMMAMAGVEFFPKNDSGMVFFRIQGQVGSSLSSMAALAEKAEQVVRKTVPEAETVTSEVGVGDGFAAMFSEGTHSGLIRVRLKPLSERQRRQPEIEEAVRQALAEIPGIEAPAFQPFSFGSDADLTIEIVGHDLAVARQVGLDVKRLIQKVPGARDVSFSLEEAKPELTVTYDRPRLARLGLSTSEVSSAVSAFFQGTIATLYRENGDDYDILVRTPKAFRDDPANLGTLTVASPLAGNVQLASVARIEEVAGPVKVTRRDQERLYTLNVTSADKDLGGLTERVEKVLHDYTWPSGFTWNLGGSAQEMKESFQDLGLALIAALLLVYMVMAGQFESYRTPFIIFLTVPFALIGVGLALFLTGLPLSVTALIGVVILVGVVVNNSIVLVDFANQLMDQGLDAEEAVRRAGQLRLRPILMTTLTTVLGMLPMALEIGDGAESWSPLARSVIGGLSVTLLVTLFVVPNFFIWFHRKSRPAPAAE